MRNTLSKRNSNIEVLRLVSMLLIILYHGTRSIPSDGLSTYSWFSMTLLGSWGLLGVGIFVFASAWYSIGAQTKSRKIFEIIFQLLCYVFAMAVAQVLFLVHQGQGVSAAILASIKALAVGFLSPLWASQYWFVTAYIISLLCLPLVNYALRKLTVKSIKRILIITAFISSSTPNRGWAVGIG